MNKIILTFILSVLSQSAFASDIYCGANTEQNPGSQIYNKLIFWEKMDTSKSSVKFLLADGTLIKSEDLTSVLVEKVVDGTLAMSISFIENHPQLFLGRVKRNESHEIRFTDVALSSSQDSNSPLLMANGATLLCREM